MTALLVHIHQDLRQVYLQVTVCRLDKLTGHPPVLTHQSVLSCHPVPEGISWRHKLEKGAGALFRWEERAGWREEAKRRNLDREVL